MKILYISNKVKHYNLGFKNSLDVLLGLGHEITWAADFSSCDDSIPLSIKKVSITINSNPLNISNYQAYKSLIKLCELENFDSILCSTPIGGFLGRTIGKKMKVKRVLYAAHGFLFFKGNNIFKNFIFLLEEKILSRYTDGLITIIEEDYESGKKLKLRGNGKRYLIHGAGIQTENIININVNEKRSSIGVSNSDFCILSAGFLNKNKNNIIILRAINKIKEVANIRYIICGEGKEAAKLQKYCKNHNITDKVIFLGYRKDILELMAASDCFVMPSYREGVPRALLEAMSIGMPCIGSNTRGIRDLLIGEQKKYICNPGSSKQFAKAMQKMAKLSNEEKESIGKANKEIVQKYSSEVVMSEYKLIYKDFYGE